MWRFGNKERHGVIIVCNGVGRSRGLWTRARDHGQEREKAELARETRDGVERPPVPTTEAGGDGRP